MSDYESFEPVDSQVDLSSFDDEFETAEAPSYEEVPDGKYQVNIESVKLEQSQKGDPMIKWDLLVIAGRHQGRHIFKNSVITQASLPYVKSDLRTLGLELSKFSDLSGRLDELLDVNLEVTKRTRGDYTKPCKLQCLRSRKTENLFEEGLLQGGATRPGQPESTPH